MRFVRSGSPIIPEWLLPVLTQSCSGKQLAQSLAPYRDYQISAYRFYSTSAVYYSGNRLTLIQSEQSIEKYRHKGLNWYAKYTMSVMTMAEFHDLPGVLKMVLVPRRLQRQFLEETAAISGNDIERIAVKDCYVFYRIKPIQ